MKRRAFLGFLGGAAAAGPSAAASLVEPLAKASLPLDYMGTDNPKFESSSSDGSWKISRIADLVRRLSGQKTKHEIEEERLSNLEMVGMAYRYQVDGLRSVSIQHKLEMIARMQRRRNAERERHWWERELFDLRGY